MFSSSHCLSNIVFCGCCGEFYRRIHWYNRGKKSVVWRCISRLENTDLFCDARTVPESQIEQVLVTAINQTWSDKDTFLAILQRNIEAVLKSEKCQPLTDIDKQLAELHGELLKRTGARADFEDVAEAIYRLRGEKQKLQLENGGRMN